MRYNVMFMVSCVLTFLVLNNAKGRLVVSRKEILEKYINLSDIDNGRTKATWSWDLTGVKKPIPKNYTAFEDLGKYTHTPRLKLTCP
ncbi:unnamed protein product [Brassica napus]|uniref:(rape) hypothetical protein n=1 Tax=Brassica napus TaxID=3708 RepID=A0A816W787_BRANA|nr:unnamed protein product [Brassica napus]